MKILESGENYLETILMLKESKGSVRSIDIVRQMNFSKPSVSRAMKLLREDGDVTMDAEGVIELTPSSKNTTLPLPSTRWRVRNASYADFCARQSDPSKKA